MLSVFFGGGNLGTVRRSKTISTVPWTSTSPRMDIIPSNSADRTGQVSPTTTPANTLSSPHWPCYLIHIYQSNLTVILGIDHRIVDSFPSYSSISALVIVLLKDPGMRAHQKLDLLLYMLSDPRFDIRMLSRYPRKLLMLINVDGKGSHL